MDPEAVVGRQEGSRRERPFKPCGLIEPCEVACVARSVSIFVGLNRHCVASLLTKCGPSECSETTQSPLPCGLNIHRTKRL